MAETNRAIPHVKDGNDWVVTPQQRDPDPQSPAGGVSSTARDLAQWVRLQLAQGSYDGTQLIPAAALAPMHLPQAVNNVPQDPALQRAGFYGLGSNVSYTDFGAVQWSHSGAFSLGAGTAYFLLPGSGFGVLALTNGAPVGAAESLCLSVLDLATTGDITRDWLQFVAPKFAAMAAPEYGMGTDWDTPPATATEALPDEVYLGTYRNDVYGDAEITSTRGRSRAADRSQATRVSAHPLRPRHLFLATGGRERDRPQWPLLSARRARRRVLVPRRVSGSRRIRHPDPGPIISAISGTRGTASISPSTSSSAIRNRCKCL